MAVRHLHDGLHRPFGMAGDGIRMREGGRCQRQQQYDRGKRYAQDGSHELCIILPVTGRSSAHQSCCLTGIGRSTIVAARATERIPYGPFYGVMTKH